MSNKLWVSFYNFTILHQAKIQIPRSKVHKFITANISWLGVYSIVPKSNLIAIPLNKRFSFVFVSLLKLLENETIFLLQQTL